MGGSGNDVGLCRVRIHGGAALWDGLRLGGEIPAFAGMTWEGVGMTWEGVGMTCEGVGVTCEGVGVMGGVGMTG